VLSYRTAGCHHITLLGFAASATHQSTHVRNASATHQANINISCKQAVHSQLLHIRCRIQPACNLDNQLHHHNYPLPAGLAACSFNSLPNHCYINRHHILHNTTSTASSPHTHTVSTTPSAELSGKGHTGQALMPWRVHLSPHCRCCCYFCCC
jgi:hypothetical protein